MLFFVRKLAEAMLLPVGLTALVVLAAVILRRRMLALAAVVFLYVCATAFTGRMLMRPLENAYPAQAAPLCPTADAIVALSGDIVRGINKAGVDWGDAAARYFGALELAKQEKAGMLVFTGADLGDGSGMTEGSVLAAAAAGQGIATDRIRVTGRVETTADEAEAVSRFPGVRSVLLVTSAVHMPRAVMLFRSRGLQVYPYPVGQRFPARLGTDALSFTPTADGMQETSAALHEYYGLMTYRILQSVRGHPGK